MVVVVVVAVVDVVVSVVVGEGTADVVVADEQWLGPLTQLGQLSTGGSNSVSMKQFS